MTRSTGVCGAERPKSRGAPPPPRPVIPATTPNSSRQRASSKRGTGPGTGVSVIQAFDVGAEGLQPRVDLLVAPFDLADVVDGTGALGRPGGPQHGHSGPGIGG